MILIFYFVNIFIFYIIIEFKIQNQDYEVINLQIKIQLDTKNSKIFLYICKTLFDETKFHFDEVKSSFDV